MKNIKTTLNILKKIFFGILFFLIVYVSSAFFISKITVNSDAENQSHDVPIYIMTNGVHTDIVLPVKNEMMDWSKKIKIANTKANDSTATFLAFGWGDKGFYLDTPEWSDLKVSTAFNAAFGLGNTAIHTTFYKNLKEDRDCVKLMISKENYQELIKSIENSFQLDTANNPIVISSITYGKNDSFYEAKGKYSLFHTCNTWANNVLKSAHQKAALWIVTDRGIFCHY